MSKFRPLNEFLLDESYRLLPFRFRRMPTQPSPVLLTNDTGEHLWLAEEALKPFIQKQLPTSHVSFWDLESRHFLARTGEPLPIEPMATQIRSRKASLLDGPALHIFVVSLRCSHSCQYCQVSRQIESEDTARFDMSRFHIDHAIGHVLRSPAKFVTVEFQGGEPLLAFDAIRFAVERLEERNKSIGKTIRYVITSILQHLSDDRLDFIRKHRIELSTSLDGPRELHNGNRPLPTRDSYQRTIEGIGLARARLGEDSVAALTTITRKSLASPEAIIDSYRELNFHSIFLRPLSPYGFASKSLRSDYSIDEFLAFYRRAISYLIKINIAGYPMDEAYAALLLRNIMTPFSNGYVDLRSPSGAGFGTWVYNYDGLVYASDEARMLAAMGDTTFCMGSVTDTYDALLNSPAMRLVASGAVAESIPACESCAYLPFCGSDPIDSYRRQGDVIGHRPTSDFCRRQMGVLDLLFEYLHRGNAQEMAVLTSWINRCQPQPTDDPRALASP